MRGRNPNTTLNACWLFQPGAPGSAITISPIKYSSTVPKVPSQIARRDAENPYTSVNTSPKM